MNRATQAINEMNSDIRAQFQAKADQLGVSLEDHVSQLLQREVGNIEQIAAGVADDYSGS